MHDILALYFALLSNNSKNFKVQTIFDDWCWTIQIFLLWRVPSSLSGCRLAVKSWMSTPGNFALLKTWIQSARMLMSKNNERWSKWKKMSDFPIIADVVFQNMKREELGLKHTILNSQGPEKKTNLIYTFFMEFFDCTLELLPSHSPYVKNDWPFTQK